MGEMQSTRTEMRAKIALFALTTFALTTKNCINYFPDEK